MILRNARLWPMRTIKGLTVKQWFRLLGLPATIAAECALILALSGDVANTAAFMVVVFVLSVCVAVYVTSGVNAYHEWRGEIMSREDLQTELMKVVDELGYYRSYVSRIESEVMDLWIKLEKNGIARDKE